MSMTVSTCEEICKSPTNNSPSKMLFSFPKSTRFNTRKVIQCEKFYDLPSAVLDCRTTSLGFGNKYDFTHDSPKFPPPNCYNIKSAFEPNKTTGFGFGKGREEMEMTGPLLSVKKNKNPGPGSYQIPTTVIKSSFSFRGKYVERDREKSKIPGPGAYPVPFCINKQGTYFLAKYKNSCVRNFIRPQENQSKSVMEAPGPGTYDMSKVDLSPKGKYAMSKMHNCLTRKFGISNRQPLADLNDFPGPGNYKIPSEFGHYVAKRICDTAPHKTELSPGKNN